jgi:hypothetical protein
MAIELDDAAFPLLIVRFGPDWTPQDFSTYLLWYFQRLQRHQQLAVVFDATRARAPSALERRQQADFLREHEGLLRLYCAGAAFVISSAVIRGALTAIFWVQPPVYEHTVVPTVVEATAWARQRLASNLQRQMIR